MERIGELAPEMGAAPGHMGFLHALSAADGPLTPGELGTRLGLMPATVTGALTALEEQRLVERRRSDEDRRAVLVAITPRGRDVARRWGDTVMTTLREVFEPLSEADLASIADTLARVAPPIHGPPRDLLSKLRHDAARARPARKGAKGPRGRKAFKS